MADEHVDVEEMVSVAFREVLGYVPAREDDLTDAIDSMQRLELLVTLEHSLAIPFEDGTLAAAWWSSYDGVLGYVKSAREGSDSIVG